MQRNADTTTQDDPALAAQRADALPLTAFYDAENVELTAPGTLIRSEPGTGYDLPGGVTAIRIAYTSRDAAGEPVPATGVVLLPPGAAPEGGWPVIAWAHGTAGVARCCAPSLRKNISYGWNGLFLYPLLGFAVVATDYAGLGGPGVHQYMWSRAQGNDVAYSVPAARAAVPELGSGWVGIGHSQGGYAVLRIPNIPDESAKAGFLGGVVIASGADMAPIWQRTDKRRPTVGATIPMMALSIKTVFPDFDLTKMIGPGAQELLPVIAQDACLGAAEALMQKVPAEQARVEGWMGVPEVAAFARENRIFTEPLEDPVLLILSEGDQYIPEPVRRQIETDFHRVARQPTFELVPRVTHTETINASLRTQLRWIADRFAAATDADTRQAGLAP